MPKETRAIRRRGTRSADKVAKRAARFESKRETAHVVAEQHTTSLTVRHTLPNTFYRIQTDPQLVHAYIRRTYPTFPPALSIFPGAESETENIRIFCRATSADEQSLGPGGVDERWVPYLPPFVRRWLAAQTRNFLYAARFVNQISGDVEQQLYRLWERIEALGLVLGHKRDNRSGTPAAHFGIWQTPGNPITIAGDGKQEERGHRRPPQLVKELQRLVAHFMYVLKKHVVKRIEQVLEREFPIMTKFKTVVQAYIKRNLKIPEGYECFNLGGVVTMVAVKFGASEVPHCDWLDAWSLLSIVVSLSRNGFVGADLVLPQLDGRMPLPRRSFGLARTRALCHWATPMFGDRLVLTFFLPALLIRNALINARPEDLL